MNKSFLNIIVISILTAILMIAVPCFGGDEVIYGCVGKAGNLRVVSSTSKCLPFEKSIFWNVLGPSGVANGITAAAYAYVESNGTFSSAIPPSESFLGVTKREGNGNYGLALNPDVFLLDGLQPRCIVNTITFGVTCAQFGWEGAGAQIYCTNANQVATDATFSVICVQ